MHEKIEKVMEQSKIVGFNRDQQNDFGVRLTVTPLCPPTTGTTTSEDKARLPIFSATKVDARTTSRVVTPKRLWGLCVNRSKEMK